MYVYKHIPTIGKFEIPMCDIDQLNFKIDWDWGGNLKVETLVYMFTITISRNLGQTNLGWSLTQCDYYTRRETMTKTKFGPKAKGVSNFSF